MSDTPRKKCGRQRLPEDAKLRDMVITMRKEDIDFLTERARTERISRSALVRRLLEKGLQELKN